MDTHARLSTRSCATLALLAVFAVAGLVRLGDPEPALPRCTERHYLQAPAIRCRP